MGTQPTTQYSLPNIPSLLMVQPNTANSATQNEIPALQTEIEKEWKKKVQCQHCSNFFTTEYIERHVQKCQLYEKIIQNGLECSICTKRFEKKCDVKKHIFDNHREMVDLSLSSTQISSTKISSTKNSFANIPSLMGQPNTANSTTLNESPIVETEIEKEGKKKVQCQHCSEVI